MENGKINHVVQGRTIKISVRDSANGKKMWSEIWKVSVTGNRDGKADRRNESMFLFTHLFALSAVCISLCLRHSLCPFPCLSLPSSVSSLFPFVVVSAVSPHHLPLPLFPFRDRRSLLTALLCVVLGFGLTRTSVAPEEDVFRGWESKSNTGERGRGEGGDMVSPESFCDLWVVSLPAAAGSFQGDMFFFIHVWLSPLLVLLGCGSNMWHSAGCCFF